MFIYTLLQLYKSLVWVIQINTLFFASWINSSERFEMFSLCFFDSGGLQFFDLWCLVYKDIVFVPVKHKSLIFVCLILFMRFMMLYKWIYRFCSSEMYTLPNLWYQWMEQLSAPLEETDPEMADLIELEKNTQRKVCIKFIPVF